MKRFLFPAVVLAGCYVLFFSYVLGSRESLPPRVATHFDLAGRPNGWMSREGTVEFSLGLGILMPAFLVGTIACTRWIPARFVNIPHREYWLAAERRGGTSAILLSYALWFGCMNVLFIMGIHGLIVEANTGRDGAHASGLGTVLIPGGFLLGTAVWCGLLLRRFARKPEG